MSHYHEYGCPRGRFPDLWCNCLGGPFAAPKPKATLPERCPHATPEYAVCLNCLVAVVRQNMGGST